MHFRIFLKSTTVVDISDFTIITLTYSDSKSNMIKKLIKFLRIIFTMPIMYVAHTITVEDMS